MNNVYIHPSYPQYGIDEFGNIFSFNNNRLLKPEITSKGYLRIGIRDAYGQRKNIRIHRLVGWVFVPLPEEFNGNYDIATIDHIDGNKLNNHHTNLEWVTREENTSRAWENGYMDHMKKPCFCIDIYYRTRTPFNTVSKLAEAIDVPIKTVQNALSINRQVIRYRYIVGYLDDPMWQYMFANLSINDICECCIYSMKRKGPIVATDLLTNETVQYDKYSDMIRKLSGMSNTPQSNINTNRFSIEYLIDVMNKLYHISYD